jgi:hypothetical protein
MKAFSMLLDTPIRLDDQPAERDRVSVLAGMSRGKDEVRILLSNFDCPKDRVQIHLKNLPWAAGAKVNVFTVDRDADLASSPIEPLDHAKLELDLPAPTVKLITLKPR